MVFFNRQGWGRTLLLAALVATGAQTALAQAQRQQNYTGNGGKGMSLTIYVPQSTGLAKNQSYIPALVQGEFVSNFSNYSAISILDWERLDDIYIKLVNEAYDDNAEAKQDVVLGRLAPTSHFLTGNITKTATGYNIKMNITKTADKMTAATYSGTFTFAELDNLTGIRRASLELLQNVGVTLTEKAKLELAGAAASNQVSAQTALAKGVTAQRAGTEVAALSYYYQAASFNPALKEAVKRSTVVAASIKSGNIGADVRNDIVWRKNWVARLKETEESFYEMINADDPPYTLTYFTDIRTVNINYQAETADLSINICVDANRVWFAAMGAVQAVLDGLNATKRKYDWGLAKWPREGVSNTNPFASKKQYDITVVFGLVNQQNQVIGSQTIKLNPGFSIERTDERFAIEVTGKSFSIVKFEGVSANDISDNMTIHVASVNGVPPQEARVTITAISAVVPLIDTRDGKRYNTVRIGNKAWMAENLNYQPQTGNSWCYGNDNSNCKKYGRLYDWNTAMKVCPSGYHLPNSKEWHELKELVGESEGKKLKSRSGWDNNGNGTDEYGFLALPGGQGNPQGFEGVGVGGYWWTSTKYSRNYPVSERMYSNDNSISRDGYVYDGFPENFGFSVRCRED